MRTGLAATLVAAVVSASAGAQDIREQSAILDSIVSRQRVATARRQAFDDSLTRARLALDTVRAGALTAFVSSGERDLAAAALRMTMDSLAPLGEKIQASLRGLRFVVRRVPPPYWASERARPVAVTRLDHNNFEQNQYWEMTPRPALIASYMIDHARQHLARAAHPAMQSWVSAGQPVAPIRFDTTSTFEWSQLRLDLVSSPSVVARNCFNGRMSDCRHVLGLDSARAPVREYYDSAGRRFLVSRNIEQFRRRDYARTNACLAGSDASCVHVLEHNFSVLAIASVGQRVALLRLAVQRGGPDAAIRLLTATGTPEQQLAVTAAQPTDSLIAEWHARLRNQRVASDSMSPGMALASLGWLGLLGFLATRNRRWR